ncbi:Mannose-6-phosphate isomerase [Candidatus Paraburkholderia calva]|nr:Mannose-6-phosphate isomerase [Candidatus Paraburkholderia calva]
MPCAASASPSTRSLAKARLIDGFWQQRVIAEMNDYQFKVARLEGEFIWHSHADTDETFIVLEGELRIDFGEGDALTLCAGQFGMVPKGVVEHKPCAAGEVKLLLIEPRGVVNTGDATSDRTVLERHLDLTRVRFRPGLRPKHAACASPRPCCIARE